MDFFAKYGLQILMAILTTGAVALAKYFHSQVKNYKKMLADKKDEQISEAVDEKLEPIWAELEELRTYVLNNELTEKKHINVVVASWRFRLIQLSKEILKQNYITQKQYDQLTEFYKLYTELGGNGQAKAYYDKVMSLPIREA